jgi:hypothetical protein
MPTILRFRNFRVVIYTHDHAPAHVHVLRSVDFVIVVLSCWAGTPSIRASRGTSAAEERAIVEFVKDNQTTLCEAWEAIHGDPTRA